MPDTDRRCGTCKHFDYQAARTGYKGPVRVDWSATTPDDERTASEVRRAEPFGLCKATVMADDTRHMTDEELLPVRMITTDASDFMADLFVHRDHFCSLWSPADPGGAAR